MVYKKRLRKLFQRFRITFERTRPTILDRIRREIKTSSSPPPPPRNQFNELALKLKPAIFSNIEIRGGEGRMVSIFHINRPRL